jgi:hypothetical protein
MATKHTKKQHNLSLMGGGKITWYSAAATTSVKRG